MKVLHLSTWKEPCGIATYTEYLIQALNDQGLENDVYPLDKRNQKYLTRAELRAELANFCDQAADYDVVHIQHEFALFANSKRLPLKQSIDNFRYVLSRLRKQQKPVVVTFHTSPNFAPAAPVAKARSVVAGVVRWLWQWRSRLLGLLVHFYWRWKISRFFRRGNRHFCAVVHTKRTRINMIERGFAPQRIEVVPHAVVPRRHQPAVLTKAAAKQRLGYPESAVVMSLFGFVSDYKGYDVAMKALSQLPSNYHLAIVGGSHPEANADLTLNKITRRIFRNKSANRLGGRIRITGFVNLETLDLYHAATDVCLAPYKDARQSGSGAITWALSSGKPVIASKIPTFVEINEASDSMVLVTEGAAYELAWQIERMMSQPNLQASLVEQANRYVAANDWGTAAERFAELYRRHLGQPAERLSAAGDKLPSEKVPRAPGSRAA